MSEKPQLGVIKEYIDAVGSSSSRVRAIVVIQVIAVIIVASVAWNQQPWSWIRSDIASSRSVLQWFQRQSDGKTVDSIATGMRDEIKQMKCAENKPGNEFAAKCWILVSALDANTQDLYDYYRQQGITQEDVKKYVEDLIKIELSLDTVVDIHALGIKFHSNDNGIIGGLSLLMILVWLRLALWRHASNLELAFWRAHLAKCLRDCYELVAMRQVFTLPAIDGSDGTLRQRERPLAVTGTLLYSLPLVVQLCVVVSDVCSARAGGWSSPVHTSISIAASSLILLAIGWLVFQCARLQYIISGTWKRWHECIADPGKNRPGLNLPVVD
jgi:hypothetical protein